MKTIKLKNFDIDAGKGKAFAYETDLDCPKAHQNALFVGKRSSGKTVSAVNLIEKMKYDRLFVVSPSILSNKEMMDRLNVDPNDVYDDVDDITCIDRILEKLDQERDDLEEYQEKLKLWKKFMAQFNNNKLMNDIEDETLLALYNPISNSFEKPTHRWNGKPPMCAILFDDVVGSMLFTKGIRRLNKLTIYHRHVSPFKAGGALGVSLFFLIQTYKAQAGGISKCIRNNTTSLILFKTKNENELKDIQQECSGEVPEEIFYQFYEYATAEPHSFLFIDFHKKKEHPSSFRKNFNEYLIPTENNIGNHKDEQPTPSKSLPRKGKVPVPVS